MNLTARCHSQLSSGPNKSSKSQSKYIHRDNATLNVTSSSFSILRIVLSLAWQMSPSCLIDMLWFFMYDLKISGSTCRLLMARLPNVIPFNFTKCQTDVKNIRVGNVSTPYSGFEVRLRSRQSYRPDLRRSSRHPSSYAELPPLLQ